LAGRAGRRGAGVAALTAGVAAVGELQVRLDRRTEGGAAEIAVAGGIAAPGGAVDAEAARHRAIDEQERARAIELGDGAEPLGADPARLTPSAQALPHGWSGGAAGGAPPSPG